jgi:ABC-2 family transporter protein
MTWLTVRQFRASAIAAVVGLVVAAFLLALTPQGTELTRCVGQVGCPVTSDKFLGLAHDHVLKYLSTGLVALPGLLGAFWGAPLLARELESGTYRLAWTQSVTRARWFTNKVVVTCLASAAVCGLASLMLGAWSSAAINRDRLQPAMFAERGIVPIGYAVFALALGITFGVLIRRTVPAMAVTLLGFLGARMAMQFWLRAHLIPVKHAAIAIGSGLGINFTQSGLSLFPPPVDIPGAWTISTKLVDNAGHAPTKAFVQSACGNVGPPPTPTPGTSHITKAPASVDGKLHRCFSTVASRFHEVAAYQPASHYWPLQWAETAVYLGVAAVLVGFCFWWVRHRLS